MSEDMQMGQNARGNFKMKRMGNQSAWAEFVWAWRVFSGENSSTGSGGRGVLGGVSGKSSGGSSCAGYVGGVMLDAMSSSCDCCMAVLSRGTLLFCSDEN